MGLLCLVRHGESEGNVRRIYSGSTDHPLTFNGVDQAEIAGIKLAKYSFDIVYSSKLTRAIATAQLILNHNPIKPKEWHTTELLNERYWGHAENLGRKELEKIYSDEVLKSWHTTLNSTPPGGETQFSVYKRCLKFYRDNVLPNLDKNILIVSHCMVKKALITIIEDLPLDEMHSHQIKNAEPIIYEF